MGKISDVHYHEIDEKECSLKEAADFYFYYNLIGVDPSIISEYENYEEMQINLKNKILGKAFNNNEIPRHPRLNTSLLGISSLKGKPILVTEY